MAESANVLSKRDTRFMDSHLVALIDADSQQIVEPSALVNSRRTNLDVSS